MTPADRPLIDDGYYRLRCAVWGVNHEEADDTFNAQQVADQVIAALATLTPKEVKILRMRFGINMDQHKLDEIGQKFDVTRERIRQIEAKALRKLRHHKRKPIWQKHSKNNP